MTVQALHSGTTRDTADALLALVRVEGTASHRHSTAEALVKGPEAARNVADVVHLLCLLHGRHPGAVDHAVFRASDAATKAFLTETAEAFAEERALLAKLVVAVGPQPSTPGQAESESAVLAQHHAIDMLAQSERDGCALGAAMAIVADWVAMRTVLDAIAKRVSVDVQPSKLPDADAIAAAIRAASTGAGMERAMLFGAQQIIAQHRGLWDLLEARAIARHNY